jgi:hypothetical protein
MRAQKKANAWFKEQQMTEAHAKGLAEGPEKTRVAMNLVHESQVCFLPMFCCSCML